MTDLKLYKSTSKGLKIIGMSIPFVVIGIWMILQEPTGTTNYTMGWLCAFFFGLGIPVGLFILFDKRPQLIINENGIWDRTTKQDVIKWRQILEAYPLDIYGQKFISIVSDDTFVFRKKPYKWAAKFNKKIGAQNLNLYIGQLNIDENKLIELIHYLTKVEEKDRNKIIQSFKINKGGFSLSSFLKIPLYISISIALLLFSLTGITAFMTIMITMGLAALICWWYRGSKDNSKIRKFAEIIAWFGFINMILFLATIKTYEHISVSVGQKISLEIGEYQKRSSTFPNDLNTVKENLDLNPLERIFVNRIEYSFTDENYELKTINLFNKQRIFNQNADEWE